MAVPVVPIISNALTPYRLHYHRRLVREVPGLSWASLFTHDVSNAPWEATDEAEIGMVRFGPGERSDDQSRWSRAGHEYRKAGRVIEWIRRHRAAAVVLLGYNDAGRLRIIRWCHRRRIPCLLFGDSNIRSDRSRGWRGSVKRLILPRLIEKCPAILACGSLGREYFRKYGVPDERIFYTPYEPDYEMIASVTPDEVAAALSRRGLPPGRDFLMYCGRLVAVKRVDLVIDAFAAVAAERPNWDLLILGDGPLREALQARLPNALRPRAHWIGFSPNQREVSALQRAARAMILASDAEPWGVVINEAVAAGLAVIATDVVGAAAELVRDGVNGRIVACGDLAQTVSAVRDVTDPARLASYRSHSAQILADWRAGADPVQGLLSALASVGVRPAG